MLDKMQAKRAQIMADAAGMRRFPGTGYHDNDPLGPVKHPDPIGRRDARIDEHVVAFKLPYETVFIAPDAERVAKTIQEFAAAREADLLRHGLDQESRSVIETAVEYAKLPVDPERFVVRNQQFNTILAVIGAQNIGVTVTGV